MKLWIAATSLVSSTAFAHPGHGHTDPESWTHYLTEPVHVIPLALAVSAVATAWFVRRRLARARG